MAHHVQVQGSAALVPTLAVGAAVESMGALELVTLTQRQGIMAQRMAWIQGYRA